MRLKPTLPVLAFVLFVGVSTTADDSTTADKSALASKSLFEKPVRLEAGGEPINLKPNDDKQSLRGWFACPAFHDMDGDGDLDLISGDFTGKFRVFRNVGSDAEPVYVKPYALQTGGVDIKVPDVC